MQVPVMKMLTTCIVQYQQNYSDISVMIAEFTVMLAIASLSSESSATTAFKMLTWSSTVSFQAIKAFCKRRKVALLEKMQGVHIFRFKGRYKS